MWIRHIWSFMELAVRIPLTITLFFISLTIIACNSANSDWEKADAAKTAAAYQQFLKEHPNDSHAQQARERLQRIEDNDDWSTTQNSNSLEAYQQYIQRGGTHVADARARILALERAAAWKNAQAANTEVALQDFLKTYNEGPEADQARSQLQTLESNGYRVEFATFKDQLDAAKAHDRFKARFGNELSDVVVIPPAGSEARYRVVSAPMSEADANAACAKIKKAHQSCKVSKS